jgi:hypothetical protein
MAMLPPILPIGLALTARAAAEPNIRIMDFLRPLCSFAVLTACLSQVIRRQLGSRLGKSVPLGNLLLDPVVSKYILLTVPSFAFSWK